MMRAQIARWLAEERGQDVIEYALLTAFIGVVIVAAIDGFQDTINAVYGSWDATTQAIWEPPNPQ